MKETLEKIEKNMAEMAKLGQFNEDYKELITALLRLKRESRILDLIVDEVALPERWAMKYPNLYKEMEENGLDKLLGFALKRPLW